MNLRNILFAFGSVALVVGAVLAAVWFVQSGTGVNGGRTNAPTVSVLVAAARIPPGTLLRAQDMAWKDMEASQVPPAGIRKTPGAEEALLGAVARRAFAAGEPLVPSGVVKPGERGFLAAILAPGMRAVSVAVDAPTSTAGLILPGDFVDVMLEQALSEHGAVSETVLQNVRVIAVDQSLSGAPTEFEGTKTPLGPAKSRIPKTITLEVSEQDAKRVLVATQLGKVTLVMRALEGAYNIPVRPAYDTEPVWGNDVSAALRGGKSVARKAGRRSASIVIMRGSKTEVR